MVRLCKQITKSPVFHAAIVFAIVLGGIIVGLETSPKITERYGPLLFFLDDLILAFFVIEIAIKIIARGKRPWLYFWDRWNVFDFVIVAACFLPLFGESLAILRIARVFRILRLVTVLPRMQVLVGALLESIPAIGYVFLLLILQFYVYAVMGVFLFGKNDPIHFGSLPIAMISLFRVVTLEDWTDIMYIQMYGSDTYGYENYADLAREPEAMPILAALYFVSFVMLGTMIILNLFIGVIITGMSELQDKANYERLLERRQEGGIRLADEITLLSKQLEDLKSSLQGIQTRVEKETEAYRALPLRRRNARRQKQLRVVRGGR